MGGQSIKVVATSDLHGYLPVIPECDLLCICGDIVLTSIQNHKHFTESWLLTGFKKWCEEAPCDKVLFIAGNHDIWFNKEFMTTNFPKEGKVTYLQDELYTYKGKTIYGTPYCQIFGNWAFMLPPKELEETYSKIPENLDILMTHDQPRGYGDVLLQEVWWNDGSNIGNKQLATAVLEKQPRYMFVGHLHSTTHQCVKIGETRRYNVSISDEYYNPVYSLLKLEI